MALPAAAQHPDQVKGFQANGVYQFNGIDNVNLFNGNLTLSLPIGPVYPVGGGLSYQLRLHSNGNVWESELIQRPNTTEGWYTFAFADRNANAGVGWTLTLGRLYPIHEWTHNESGGWAYQSPDGAEHVFRDTLHESDAPVANFAYTRDSSYLRMQYVAGATPADARRLIEFPDGTIQTFRPDLLDPANPGTDASHRPWLLEKIGRRGSAAEVTMTYSDRSPDTKQHRQWIISDGFRTHKVVLKDYAYDANRTLNLQLFPYDTKVRTLVDYVDLAAFGAKTARYSFGYGVLTARRPEWHDDPTSLSSRTPDLQSLTSLTLPDETKFEFAYIAGGLNDQSIAPKSMVLPTGGRIEWEWDYYWLPRSQCGDPKPIHRPYGVRKRKLFHRGATTAFATWSYDQIIPNESCFPTIPNDVPKEIATVVTDPAGHKTENHFSVALENIDGFLAVEYGLPFTRTHSDNATPPRWLSQRFIPAGQSNGRATYVRYERDLPAPDLPPEFDSPYNQRVVSRRVVFEDGLHMDTDWSDFDGLGHYRTVRRGGTATGGTTKIDKTNYNPGSGTYPGTFVMVPTSEPWLLNDYDRVSADENPPSGQTDAIAETLLSETCFDAATGRLQRTRTYRDTGRDVVVVYEYDSDGNVKSEAYSGGETTGIASGNTCTGTPRTPDYKIHRSWSKGALEKSWYDGFENDFLTLRLDIDSNTGLPSASYPFFPTGTQRRTDYGYDTMGRLTSVKPPGIAQSIYTYDGAASPTHVKFTQIAAGADPATATPLTESHYYYDGVGRLVQQKQSMPDGGWSTVVSTYDHDGRERSQTVPVRRETSAYESSITANTRDTDYDGFGRVKKITEPDHQETKIDYTGVVKRDRTVRINTGTDQQRDVMTTESYDGFGRLTAVEERPENDVVHVTSYAYDLGDRLAKVTQGSQIRTFTYDRAGLLTSEDHPETALTSYTYDARGQVLSRTVGSTISLKFAYDAAERLLSVRDAKHGDRLLKEFVYDETTLPGGSAVDEPGRLVKQTRWNWFDGSAAPYVVSNHFTFDGSGRTDRKTTTVEDPAQNVTRFEQEFDYTELNRPSILHYPLCPTCGSGLPGDRAIGLSYRNGFLTNVNGVTADVDATRPGVGLTYTAAGQVHQVRHAAPHAGGAEGVLDTIQPDATGMARPARITVSNAADCRLITAQSEDQTRSGGQTATFSVTAAAGSTFQWYQGRTGDTAIELTGETDRELTTPALTQTTHYWCLVTGPDCRQGSRTFTAKVCAAPAIDAPAADFAGEAIEMQQHAATTLEVTVRNAGRIAWRQYAVTQNADGSWTRTGSGTPLAGTTAAISWTAPAHSAAGPNFHGIYAAVTATCGSAVVERLVRVFEVTPGCQVPSISAPSADYDGDAVAIRETTASGPVTITVSGTASSYEWQQALVLRSGSNWIPAGAATTLSASGPSLVWTAPAHVANQTLYGLYATVSGCGTTSARRLVRVFEVTACAPPRQRDIRSSGGAVSGTTITLSVEDDADGVTFQWYEGFAYDDLSKPLGTTAAIPVEVGTDAKFYWVRMTRVCGTKSVTTDTAIFAVDPSCRSSILVQPKSSTKAMPDAGTVTLSASVVPGGTGPFTYKWYEEGAARTDANVLTTSHIYTWTHTVAAGDAPAVRKRVYAEVTGCGGPAYSETITLSISKTAQRIAAYNKIETVYRGTEPARLYVVMDPEPSPQSSYTYEWYRVHPNPAKLGATGSSINVTTSSIGVYRVKVTGTHTVGTTTYQEETHSQSMYVTLYGACALPPLEVSQSHGNITSGAPDVSFYALSDWPAVRYDWYHGQSGDTRHPVDSVAGVPNLFTTDPIPVTSFWVRASLACGAHVDSPTLKFRRLGCEPVLVDPNIASVDVAYDGNALLSVERLLRGTVQYRWYEGEDDTHPVTSAGTTPNELLLQNVKASGRYWVKVRNLDCDNYANSYIATVRVASALGLTPPAPWPAEVWTYENQSVDLQARSGGATGYQWYRGEVGDTRAPIGGATAETYPTGPLAANAKYWVRVTGAQGVVDSPTMTVRVCSRPALVETPWLEHHIIPNQLTAFTIKVRGTNLTYQWYQGRTGDTAKPVGRPVDRLEVQPAATTEYWVRVTAGCGIGTAAERQYDSPTFRASVCPVIAEPTADLAVVMRGTTTTLRLPVTDPSWTYQWYAGARGVKTNPIANSNSPTITTPPIQAATTFWCDITSGSCSTPSAEVTVSLCQEPTITWTTGDRSIARGERVFFHVTTTGNNVLKTFYAGNAGDVANSQIVHGPSTNDFSMLVEQTTKFWVRATIGNCYADTGNITVTVCIPKITGQPVGKAITLGGSHTMSVATDIPAAGYQWYEGEKGVTTKPVANGNQASVTVSPTADAKYWVRVRGCGTSTVDSDAVLVSVCTPPSIRDQAPSQWITKGTPVQLHVDAAGTNLTYRWYIGTSGDVSQPTNQTAASVFFQPDATTKYWVRVSNGCRTADGATITVSVCAPPHIETQPQSQTIFSGRTASFSVTATQATATPMTYQWYRGTTAENSTAITGATLATYTTPALTAGASYWVEVKAGTCRTPSAVATVSLCAYPEVIDAPADKDIAVGGTANLGVTMNPPIQSATWYRGVQGDRSNPISAQIAPNVSPQGTTQYWGELSDGTCTSKTRTVTVHVSIPTITAHPASRQVAPGQSATFSVTATPATGLTYQWYSGSSGSGTAIPGATGSSYSTGAFSLGMTASFWVKVTGPRNHSVNSNTASVTVCEPAEITSPPSSASIRRGSSVTLLAFGKGTNLRHQWYAGASGYTANPVGAVQWGTSSSVSVSPNDRTQYWVAMVSDCGYVNSAAVTVDVCVDPGIQQQPQSKVIFSGRTATFSVGATSGTSVGLSYQWYEGESGSGTAIPGATDATYTTPALTSDRPYWVRVTSGACSIDSNTAWATMCVYPETIGLSDRSVARGGAATLSTTLSPPPESAVWYQGARGDRSLSVGAGTSVTVYPTVTTQYWAEFTYGGCATSTNTATVSVCIPTITVQPVSKKVPYGTSASLSVTATEAVSYQWFLGSTPGFGTAIDGATSATYTTPPATSLKSYYVRVYGSCNHNPMYSRVVTVSP